MKHDVAMDVVLMRQKTYLFGTQEVQIVSSAAAPTQAVSPLPQPRQKWANRRTIARAKLKKMSECYARGMF
jgi:hypothetical protein